mmetsp:Transcript_32427/g.76290  ORF Transcript_32427/g.76290 Transcript_32427/m.76290 type:complete len:406 (+) Transcript_32427:199-1416(+)
MAMEHSMQHDNDNHNDDGNNTTGSMTDPSKFRELPPGFQCGEELEDGGIGSIGRCGVSFYCVLPPASNRDDTGGVNGEPEKNQTQRSTTSNSQHQHQHQHQEQQQQQRRKLTFRCRDRSVGVLESKESAITKAEYDATDTAEAMDPFFFDAGYTLAGRTGFQVWSGTRLMIESLLFHLTDDSDRLVAIQKEINSTDGKDILELGAGVGVVGTTLAAATACRVLLTDLPTLVENSLLPNLKQNQDESRADDKQSVSEPAWLRKASANMEFEEEEDDEDVVFPLGDRGGWGSIANIDWTERLNEEVSSVSSLDWIIASDCVWLISMLDSLLNTVDSLFRLNPKARLILSFQRRDAGDTTRFSTVEGIVDNVRNRGWSIDCLAWRYVRQEGSTEPKEVFVFEIIPGSK